MRCDWQKFSIADLLAQNVLYIGDGYRAKLEELDPAGLPFARAGNIDGGFHFDDADRFPEQNLLRVGNKVSQAPDVVFTSKGTVGRFALVRQDTPRFVYSPQLCFWRVLQSDRICPRFLFYWMSGREFYSQYKGVAGQTDMAEYVSLSDQRRMYITLPPLGEQRAIAHILGTLDDKIELNHRTNETLEAMARTIFKSWFVDFDPVRAKAEGRQPSGMEAATAALFPDSFEDSPLGKIPKGWSAANLAEFAVLNPEVWTRHNAPDHIEYVDLSNVKRGRIETTASYLWKDAPTRAQRVLRPGDTIVGTVRPGNSSYAFISDNSLTGSTGFAVLRPRKSFFREIVYLAATALDNMEKLAHLADGAAYPAVRPGAVASTDIPKAPDPILDCFSKAVGPLLKSMAASCCESRTLAATRDALLPKLISGEIRAEDHAALETDA
ncbi:MAG TPA: restriction endonuclease subunit S [Candidatus Acidoferrales bacterium]|nr:restriction endonuclease subunit S [Candidatus Acidoferrales bacterium]